MKRTSVLIDVEDPLYYEVVEPMKRNKSFTKLVVSLLNGYSTDRYIRAYIDDSLEEVHKAVVGSFESSVSDMEDVLSNMGLLTDELKGQAYGGYQRFKEHAETASSEPQSVHESRKDSEVEELKERVATLEKTISNGFETLFQQLQNMSIHPIEPVVSQANRGTVVLEKPIVEDRTVSSIREDISIYDNSNNTSSYNEPVFEEEQSVDKDAANDFLSNLVADFSSF